MKKRNILLALGSIIVISIFIFKQTQPNNNETTSKQKSLVMSGEFDESMTKTNDEWGKILTSEQYHVLREAGTEIPFTGILNNEKRKGTYYSVGCDKPLFRSEQKYDSGTGWPSFSAPINQDSLVLRKEGASADDRIEVLDTCGGHLGHVFDDGPEPTGRRYCINSIALKFIPDKNQ